MELAQGVLTEGEDFSLPGYVTGRGSSPRELLWGTHPSQEHSEDVLRVYLRRRSPHRRLYEHLWQREDHGLAFS